MAAGPTIAARPGHYAPDFVGSAECKTEGMQHCLKLVQMSYSAMQAHTCFSLRLLCCSVSSSYIAEGMQALHLWLTST